MQRRTVSVRRVRNAARVLYNVTVRNMYGGVLREHVSSGGGNSRAAERVPHSSHHAPVVHSSPAQREGSIVVEWVNCRVPQQVL